MNQIVASLKKAKTKEECLRKAYDALVKKYHGNRIKTYLRLWELFLPLRVLWRRQGFLHCTNFNRFLRSLLLQSGHFTADDVRYRWTLLWYISPHQYLRIRITPKRWISVDAWAHVYGIQLGDYAHGFHAYT
jgi:hypothetical protein